MKFLPALLIAFFAIFQNTQVVDACDENQINHLNREIIPRKDGFLHELKKANIWKPHGKCRLYNVRLYHFDTEKIEPIFSAQGRRIGRDILFKNLYLHSREKGCKDFSINCKGIFVKQRRDGTLNFSGTESCKFEKQKSLSIHFAKRYLISPLKASNPKLKQCPMDKWEIEDYTFRHDQMQRLYKVHLINSGCNSKVICDEVDVGKRKAKCDVMSDHYLMKNLQILQSIIAGNKKFKFF